MKKPARPDVEYVLVYNYPPYARTPDEVRVAQDTVVTNVRYVPTDSTACRVISGGSSELEFTVKATGEKFTTHYGYIFALNTPNNRERLREFQAARQARDEAARRVEAAFAQVSTVAGPFEGVFAFFAADKAP